MAVLRLLLAATTMDLVTVARDIGAVGVVLVTTDATQLVAATLIDLVTVVVAIKGFVYIEMYS